MLIGEIINRVREEKHMTLLDISRKSGVAIATLSRIENGRMTGTLNSHMRIAEALEISLPDMYRELTLSKKQVELQTKKARAEVFVHDKNTASEMLTTKILNKKMLPTLIKIAKDGATHKEETRPGVEKFIYVLEGKAEAVIGEAAHMITKGDTLYFESELPHYFKNVGAGEAHILCVTCQPVL